MFLNQDIKLVLSISAGIITVISYFPYIKSILGRKTKPHVYTWLIWVITQGTAAFAIIYGGGGFGALSLIIGTFFVIFILILSFYYGTKDITTSDTITLFLAFFAILIWWLFKNLYISIILVTFIDILAYIPTIRKTYNTPTSEAIIFWIAMVVVNILIFLSLEKYNLLTVVYPFVLFTMNLSVSLLIITKRKII